MTTVNAAVSRNVSKELREGVSGSGDTMHMVCTVCNRTGSWLHIEYFKSKAEAMHWMKWC
ncbi:MAG: hypothetical protein ACOVLE_14725 [Pirellula staleyi]